MPRLRIKASLPGGAAQALDRAQYLWTVGVVMQGTVPFAMGKSLAMKPIRQTTSTPYLDIAWQEVRGGDLTVSVKVLGPKLAAGGISGLVKGKILGTNPSEPQLYKAGASDLLVKIIRHESGTHQFLWSGQWKGFPYFSHDKLHGDAAGLLVVDLKSDGQSGTGRWHEVTGDERKAFDITHHLAHKNKKGEWIYNGDPDYVANVYKIRITDPPAPAAIGVPPARADTTAAH